MLKLVLSTTGTPVVVVLSNGGVVHLPWADRVAAVLEVWLSGQAGGGAVVNIASISGLRASTLRVAYGTSKGALIHLTKQQAIEYGNAKNQWTEDCQHN